TVIPMIIGFVFAKFVLKLSLLNNLGSITGGMTSTPALGTLINVAGTDDVASAYAATYPIALIAVVLASQFLILLL
ncbi:MAG: permease, partial [Clostridia bacterium]|nr:permease [Clostridia bacterium]